nr:MAG: putative glycoprotein [Corparats virus 3]
MIWIFLFLFFRFIPIIYTIIAYDCSIELVNKTAFSLINVEPCQRKEINKTISRAEIQLIQPHEIFKINVRTCLIEMTHFVSRCGKTWQQFETDGFYDEIPEINGDDCLRHHSLKMYQVPQSHIIIDLKINQTTIWGGTTIGITKEGYCTEGESQILNGKLFDRPLRSTKIRATLHQLTLDVDIDSDKVIFPDGTQCSYLKFECFTTRFGYGFWSLPNVGKDRNSCFRDKTRFVILYQGQASKVVEYVQNHPIPKVTYLFEKDNYHVALETRTSYFACNAEIIQTEHPKLQIIENLSGVPNNFPLDDYTLYRQDVNIMTYFNQKLSYLLRHVKEQVDEMYKNLQYDRCRVERIALKNMLSIAYISPELFAYHYFEEPGYTAIRTGEIIHVAKCKKTTVQFRTIKNKCYDELPISYKNESKFLTPVTHIIINHGTEINCNQIANTMYNIEGVWVSVFESLQRTKAPQLLGPAENEWEFEDIPNLIANGLYSQENLNEAQKMFIAPIENVVAQVVLAKKVIANTEEGADITFINALTSIDVDRISQQMEGWFYGLIRKLGVAKEYLLDLMAIIFFLQIVGFILSRIFNCLTVNQMGLGCLSYLFSCFSNGMNFLINRYHIDNINKHRAEHDIEMGLMNKNIERIESMGVPQNKQRWIVPDHFEGV